MHIYKQQNTNNFSRDQFKKNPVGQVHLSRNLNFKNPSLKKPNDDRNVRKSCNHLPKFKMLYFDKSS